MARLEGGIGDLAKDFVCVRVIQMRGIDTSVFQFDYDLTWCGFFLNADLTVYGRYGSRNAGRDKSDQLMSVDGLKAALTKALALHKNYPANKATLKAKTGKPYAQKLPETMPAIADQFKQDDLPKKCIHCHHVWRGIRRTMMNAKQVLPDTLIYLYPFPDSFGMQMETADGTKVRQVVKDSIADKAGVKAGDEVEAVSGTPIVSLADIQFILQNCADNENLKVEVARGGEKKSLTANLCGDWRKSTDFTWRDSCYDLRIGFQSEALTADERKQAGLKDGGLKIKPMYAQSPAKKAGFQDGDILLSVGGQPIPATEREFLALLRQKFLVGQKLKFALHRGGKKTDLTMDLP
ncbi:MAG: PDZ/DHR/GLGF domain-containing [Planctomycetota bacterium]|nr:MAG: PDZ/DHR/GLGF domain-containing [Planctomycetota bacterium]